MLSTVYFIRYAVFLAGKGTRTNQQGQHHIFLKLKRHGILLPTASMRIHVPPLFREVWPPILLTGGQASRKKTNLFHKDQT
jgi:hypothetical protein